MMAVLFCGVALGFVLATALFIQKIWSANDKAEYYKKRAEFFRNVRRLVSVICPCLL